MEKKKVIFVCTANMYRSRLADILFNHYAQLEPNFGWQAESRAITDPARLRGMSESVGRYLNGRELESLAAEPRNPIMLLLEDFETADLIIGLCRAEHGPMFKNRFASMAQVKLDSGALRFWNVYDSKIRLPWYLRIPGMVATLPTQAEDSGTEHIDAAVRNLIGELAED